jgi:CheY-like chemotaxis protein
VTEHTRTLGKRILLVEDDLGARAAIKLLLSIDRHVVVEASGGADAIELLRSQPFDLAILDYFMPEMRGNEVALRLKAIAPALPIVMVTAYLEKLGPSDMPVDAVIGKPFAIEDLRRAIAKLVA